MQANMKKAQERDGRHCPLPVSRGAGNGQNYDGHVSTRYSPVEIDDSLLGDDKEMLEDLIVAAFNDSIRKVEKDRTGKSIPGWASRIETCLRA